jgi:PIN domain nuclease of toxin-antitoxin system
MITLVLAHVFMWLHLQESDFQMSWMKYESGDNVLTINSKFELQLKNRNAHVNLCSWKLVNLQLKQ